METNDFYCDFVLNNKLKIKKEVETENVLAFHHTDPSWTFHVVIIPKKHITQLIEVKNPYIFQEIFLVIKELIIKYNLQNVNYKVITNGGDFQDSQHLHFHLVSGEKLNKNIN